MEEFKNLKEIIELSEEEINNNDENVSVVLDLVDLKELRNLIARYKELEEGKALTKKQEAMILKAIKQSAEEQITKEMKNYIPKSKVKEKIKKYNEIIYYAQTEEEMAELKDYEYEEAKYGIQILAELLED